MQIMLEGRILRAQSGFYWVETTRGVLECRLRGRLKKVALNSDIAVIGDMVRVDEVSPGYGAVEEVFPRETRLSRVAAFSGGHREDIIVANVDMALIVVALAQPEFHPRMLDRYLVICENNDIEARIIASKADLVSAETANAALKPYRDIGYVTCAASVHTGQGITEIQSWLTGKVSVVTGKSGVGKSSLLNAINPQLALAVGDVSGAVNKGRHTTTVAQLIPLGNGGYVADTPGIREIGLWKVSEAALAYGFKEFQDHIDNCRFSDCTHRHEPDCAVLHALHDGTISQARYDSYVRLLAGEE
ncbi:MAG: ribosome small subunit-dependent GTPase A [Roseiflexaceae bacterium]|jgi:ribosome biogenesis GTPase|nr:ribosome small subunit-dependent GTPase A [Chloroflexaceae bacterium]